MNILRTRLPREIEFGPGVSHEWTDAELGGGANWFWGVADVLRAVSGRSLFAYVPDMPRNGDPHASSLGYWNALHQLLLLRLGWARPDLGLAWWYEAGMPTEDPTLALVKAIWVGDERLDGYFAWTLRAQQRFLSHPGQAWGAHSNERVPIEWQQWLEEASKRDRPDLYPHFQFSTANNPLHLGSVQVGGSKESIGLLRVLDPDKGLAEFKHPSLADWYAALHVAAEQLPSPVCQPWRIEVSVPSVGIVGTYKKSRTTGFFFCTRHSIHSAGNEKLREQ